MKKSVRVVKSKWLKGDTLAFAPVGPMKHEFVDMRFFDWKLHAQVDVGASESLCRRAEQPPSMRVWHLLAPSGAGKTASLFAVARQHYVVYMCLSPYTESGRGVATTNTVFVYSLAYEAALRRIRQAVERTADVSERRAAARLGIAAAVFAHLLYLLAFVTQYPSRNRKPWDFLVAQLNGRRENVQRLFDQLWLCFAEHEVDYLALATEVVARICDAAPRNRRIIFAVDEAQASLSSFVDLFQGTTSGANRGLFPPLYAMIHDLQGVLRVFSGTATTADLFQAILSADQGMSLTSVLNMAPLSQDDCSRIVRCVLKGDRARTVRDLDADVKLHEAAELPPKTLREYLACRPRVLANVIADIFRNGELDPSDRLLDVAKRVLSETIADVASRVRALLKRNRLYGTAHPMRVGAALTAVHVQGHISTSS